MPIQSTDTTSTIFIDNDNDVLVIKAGVQVAVGGGGDGVDDSKAGAIINNFGDITCGQTGVFLNGAGGNTRFVNEAGASITAGSYGFYSLQDGTAAANYGLIWGAYDGMINEGVGSTLDNGGTIASGNNGVWLGQGAGETLTNTGTITGDVNGVYLYSNVITSVVNSGHISGGVAALALDFSHAGGVNLHNTGEIDGDFALGGSTIANSIVNAGQIVGNVTVGAGADLYDGRGGSVSGMVAGGAGNDTLIGGAGDDVLAGGFGRDRLDGGKGGAEDTFVFSDVKESRPSAMDVIAKHWTGSDLIDLSGVDGDATLRNFQDLTFGGLVNAGDPLATGVVDFFHQGGDTYVVADVDGDHKADFELKIHGSFTLTAGEFVL